MSSRLERHNMTPLFIAIRFWSQVKSWRLIYVICFYLQTLGCFKIKIGMILNTVISISKLNFVLVLIKVILSLCSGQKDVSLATVSPYFLFGIHLQGGLITKLTGQDFMACVRECITRKRCQSLNYIRRIQLCEVNYKLANDDDVVLNNLTGSVYTEISQWKRVSTIVYYVKSLFSKTAHITRETN